MFNKLKSPETLVNETITLSILNQNILYLTHTMDKCLVVLKEMKHDKDLQQTVDKYFDETSPQTDPVQEIDKLQYQKNDTG